MNFKKPSLVSILVLLLLLVLSISATSNVDQQQDRETMQLSEYPSSAETEQLSTLDNVEVEGRSLLQKKRGHTHTHRITCNKFPRICLARGSPGPQCCKKKCVNILTDRLNCGKCGKKCKYNQICCKGKCVNPWFNRNHCGGCNNRCSNGELCVFGLCNYA